VSDRTIRNYLAKGYFGAYRRPGVRGGLIFDLDEVDAALRLLPARSARASANAYGPKAVVRPLPVMAADAEPGQ
jgi:hypothetical protein